MQFLKEDYEEVYKDFKKLIDSIKYNGARYKGARIPSPLPGYINEANIPYNMRLKWFETRDLSDDDDLRAKLLYVTQEPFDKADSIDFIKEVKRAFEGLAERLAFDEPFTIALDVSCREGKEYGYLVYDIEIGGDSSDELTIDDLTITPDTKIKDAYKSIAPDDYQLDNLNPDKTIKQIWEEMQDGGDIYDIASVDGKGFDSAIREQLFIFISEAFNIDYDVVYSQWLANG